MKAFYTVFSFVTVCHGQNFISSSGGFRSSSSFSSSSGSSFSSSSSFGSGSSGSSFGSSSVGSGYLASWDEGAGEMTWHEAESWCSSKNRRMVSVDSSSKAQDVLSILTRSGRSFFWTGGFKSFGDSVRWPNGASTTPNRGSYPWSQHGVKGPQPDGGDSEKCIAALNIDFYPDGSKLHDIGCSHRKPVLCE